VVLDSVGDIYLSSGHRIRKINVSTGVITTVAGTGGVGYNGDDRAATSAILNLVGGYDHGEGVAGLAIDASGNLYIVDGFNHRIRKVSAATGVITTVAGNGVSGYNGDNIPAVKASLNLTNGFVYGAYSVGIAVDSAGDLYIADSGNQRIRKVSAASGIITTVAGNGAGGYSGDNVSATSATLSAPVGVAVDKLGNLYVADRENDRIRKVSATTGIITTVAGPGVRSEVFRDGIDATQAVVYSPQYVTVDAVGNFYFGETGGGIVRKVTVSTGIINIVAGDRFSSDRYNGDNIAATTASLNTVSGAAVDSVGNLYISDSRNYRIRKVTLATGRISTVAGSGNYYGDYGDNIPATSAELSRPTGVARDSLGNLYIANGAVYKVSPVSGYVSRVFGMAAGGTINSDGSPAKVYLGGQGIAVDAVGNLYSTSDFPSQIFKLNAATGIVTTIAGTTSEGFNGDNIGATNAKLFRPFGVAVDAAGNVFIADTDNHRVRKVTVATGLMTTVAGTGADGYNGDDIAATSAFLSSPTGVGVDSKGNVYIADARNNRVRKVAAKTGIITSVARGLVDISGIYVSGIYRLPGGPRSIAVDASDNVYFADAGRIRKLVAATDTIVTVAGTGAYGYNGDQIEAVSAWLSIPAGVAVDGSGTVYIADAGTSLVRRVGTPTPLNYQGLWWNAPAGSESGWGINFAHQGDVIFATWFTYDANGKPLWLSLTAKWDGRAYWGTLYQTRGPAFNAAPFDPRGVTATNVGFAKLSFSDANTGQFFYVLNERAQTKEITRQSFGPLPTCIFGAQPDLSRATNYQDLWWATPAGSESGWGINFAHQGDTIFATWFAYDVDGAPIWLSATAPKMAVGSYKGALYRTTGPAFSAVPFLSSSVSAVEVGAFSLSFADGNSATFGYTLNGVTASKKITRQIFNSPGTICK
jgi:trimeric autotransporter adhesin